MSSYFEMLERSNFIIGDQVNADACQRASASEIIDLAHSSRIVTVADNIEREKSIFSFSSSLSLGGGRRPCNALHCRLQRVQSLAHFASLYSDKVYIKNLLSNHINCHADSVSALGDIQHQLFEDLTVINELRPLIEAGIVVPFTPSTTYCDSCFVRSNLSSKADLALESQYSYLNDLFAKKIKFRFVKFDDECALEYSGPKSVVEHGGGVFLYDECPQWIRDRPDLHKKLREDDVVDLDATHLEFRGGNHDLTRDVMESVVFELASSQSLGTSFLTDVTLQKNVLEHFSASSKLENRNKIIQDNLTALVPFVGDLGTSELLTLREREAGAFVLFRRALNQTIDDCMSNQTGFTEQDARQIYSDVLEPQLAALDARVKNAKRDLISAASRKVVGWGTAITFGTFFGFVPSTIAAAATALGLTAVIADLADNLLKYNDSDASIRNEDLYFLWKVKNGSKTA